MHSKGSTYKGWKLKEEKPTNIDCKPAQVIDNNTLQSFTLKSIIHSTKLWQEIVMKTAARRQIKIMLGDVNVTDILEVDLNSPFLFLYLDKCLCTTHSKQKFKYCYFLRIFFLIKPHHHTAILSHAYIRWCKCTEILNTSI